MNPTPLHELLQIDRLRVPTAATNGDACAPPGDSAFARILDAARGDGAPSELAPGEPTGGDAELHDFSRAVRDADAEFIALMDLRRTLETAFRNHDR